MGIDLLVKKAEEDGVIIRPLLCEACEREKFLIRHHRDYNKPLDVTWLCYSCHSKEHHTRKILGRRSNTVLRRKIIQVASDVWEKIRKESKKQSKKTNRTVTMGDIVAESFKEKE